MKAVLVTKDRDYANMGYLFSQCFRKVGVDAVMYSEKPAAHSYPKQGIVFGKNINKIIPEIKKADIIIFIQGKYIDFGIDFSKKKVAVFYGASNFRKRYTKLNEIFNPIVDVSLIQTSDLLGLGAKNEKWITGAVDTENLKPIYKPKKSNKLHIVHYPSNPDKKGSHQISKTLSKIDYIKYTFSYNRVKWKKHIERISNSDIYIDQIIKEKDGRKFCNPGMTSFEGAALGRIIISNFCDINRYEKEFGKCAIQIANSPEELAQIVKKLSKLSNKELLNLQYKSREWVEKYHSYDAIGKRLLKIFNGIKK